MLMPGCWMFLGLGLGLWIGTRIVSFMNEEQKTPLGKDFLGREQYRVSWKENIGCFKSVLIVVVSTLILGFIGFLLDGGLEYFR